MHQLTIDDAIAARGRAGMLDGMRRSAAHAEADIPGWQEQAYDYLLAFAARGGTFVAPEVRRSFPGPAAPSAQAWGAVLRRGQREGRIMRVGTIMYGDETMHTQNVTVWRAT